MTHAGAAGPLTVRAGNSRFACYVLRTLFSAVLRRGSRCIARRNGCDRLFTGLGRRTAYVLNEGARAANVPFCLINHSRNSVGRSGSVRLGVSKRFTGPERGLFSRGPGRGSMGSSCDGGRSASGVPLLLACVSSALDNDDRLLSISRRRRPRPTK